MEQLEDNKSIVHSEPFQHAKVDVSRSPDITKMTKIWIPSERAFFYFKKSCTEPFIMERLAKYKARNNNTGIEKMRENGGTTNNI